MVTRTLHIVKIKLSIKDLWLLPLVPLLQQYQLSLLPIWMEPRMQAIEGKENPDFKPMEVNPDRKHGVEAVGYQKWQISCNSCSQAGPQI